MGVFFMRGVEEGGGNHRKVIPLKTSCCTHFWGLWVGGCQGEVIPPENEPSHTFSRVVGGGGGHREVIPPKTSRGACFRELWVVVVSA